VDGEKLGEEDGINEKWGGKGGKDMWAYRRIKWKIKGREADDFEQLVKENHAIKPGMKEGRLVSSDSGGGGAWTCLGAYTCAGREVWLLP